MADISVANAELLGLWLQLLTTGAYLLYVPRAAIALRQKMRDGLSFWLPLISGMFFVLAVMEIVVEMLRGYEAVGSHQGERPDPEAYYANPATTKSLIKNYIITAESFLSDAVIVYRTFIVWNQNLLVITIPFMLFLSSIGVGVWAAWTLSQTRSGDVLILAAVTVRVRYFFILTFCLNSVCTGLICWKIWRVTKMSVHAHVHSPLSRLLRVIVESAAVYCLYLLVLIITDSVGTNIFFTFFNISPPLVALVFSVLIVGAQKTHKSGSSLSGMLSGIRFGGQSSRGQQQSSIPGVEVRLERIIRSETDGHPAVDALETIGTYDSENKGESLVHVV